MNEEATFQYRVSALIESISLEMPQGVLVEIDHFIPDGWESRVEGGVHYVEGPGGREWKRVVKRLVGVLAYADGSLVREIAPGVRELYTWRNDRGDGFKVVFRALPED